MISIFIDPLDIPFHHFKPAKLVAEDFKPTWIARHIKWLKEDHSQWEKIALTALAILEKVILFTSIIGWGILYTMLQEEKRQSNQRAFFLFAQSQQPPSDDPIEIKTFNRSFNHVQDFAIENEIIWTRFRHHPDTWKPVYFDGFAQKHTPTQMGCDGANLIVLDEQNSVHYKKILREFRNTEIRGINHHLFSQAGVNLEEDNYIAIDKGERDNWKDKWFSLPYLSPLVNFFIGKRLQLPFDMRAWAISHRGRYNNYLEDKVGQQHIVDVGTTTLYVLDALGKNIYKYDPWSPKYVKISLPLPETSDRTFEGMNISASASTIMVIGYETSKDNPQQKHLKIYTCLADIDSKGWNPMFHYDYFKHSHDPEVFVIPLAEWESHSLDLEEDDFITSDITIIQTGEGNNERELRVSGQYQGQSGFYFKKINEPEWSFESFVEQHEELETQALSLIQSQPEEFHTTVQQYEGQHMYFKNSPSNLFLSAQLFEFGQQSYHSKLLLKTEETEFELDIYKKKTLKNFIGFAGDSYDLVIPEDLHTNTPFMQIFNHQKVTSLKINEDHHQIVLEDTSGYFKINLQAQNV